MFPLFVRSIGKFYDSIPARSLIEKFVSPKVSGTLSSMKQAEWTKTVVDYFSKNKDMIVTVIAGLGASTDVVQLLSSNAKTQEEKEELSLIERIVGKSDSAVATKSGKSNCSVDPEGYAVVASGMRKEFSEFAALLGLPESSAIRFMNLFEKISSDWPSYRAAASIK